MKDALSKVLEMKDSRDSGTDRILAASFFRTRPLQLGSSPAVVVQLDERRKTFSTPSRGA